MVETIGREVLLYFCVTTGRHKFARIGSTFEILVFGCQSFIVDMSYPDTCGRNFAEKNFSVSGKTASVTTIYKPQV